jgi:6-phosphofructo-2-kinase/fructose-2,6-biphosphatase 2
MPATIKWLEYDVKVDLLTHPALRRTYTACHRSLMLVNFVVPVHGRRPNHSASYFSHDNKEATESREKLASDSLDMLIAWLKEGGNVGIHGIASCAYRSRALC